MIVEKSLGVSHMRMLEYTMAHMWDIKSIEDLENHIDNAFGVNPVKLE
jgi:hypothetical protein